jgi:site-specific DNA-methyltransferase (adenine-specific)
MILQGSCLERLREMEENSVDSIVTDPPYELGFMGKAWDSTGIAYSVSMWRECLRVLKPGGHLLSFGGSRTYHRMACAIEDAGFEIRDQIMWIYSQGFPKSMDVSKAIDKAAGAEREVVGVAAGMGKQNPEWNGTAQGRAENSFKPEYSLTAPSTDAAKQWSGWGTALKPAHEPICVARKPLIGTVAANVQQHGTGALNIDGCRVELNGDYKCKANGRPSQTGLDDNYDPANANRPDTVGRWPANVIHDGSEEVVSLFPQTSSGTGAVKRVSAAENEGNRGSALGAESRPAGTEMICYGDSGSAARFFYCAKTSKSERGLGNIHPTVKPLVLMRYLCRIVTPPGGVVLDPFTGSGTTGIAAMREGFGFIGIELKPEYASIANARLLAEVLS